ncbi:tetratricopeptide repeat protein, partial [Nocardia gipuzkoensis]|uniref:tetratricopeptide repeat protein n=1 Tax=Nocardia gipuzkoensis TaxID=2749991 RepID=UPI0015EF43F3
GTVTANPALAHGIDLAVRSRPNAVRVRGGSAILQQNSQPRRSELYEQTLIDRERILGAEHPDTLTSRNNLASTYQAAGRTAEAI